MGGMTLSGDDLTTIPPDRLAMLKKLLPPAGVAAEFEDDSLRVGVTQLPDRRMVSLFNWGQTPQSLAVRLPEASRVTDYWTGEDLGRHEGQFAVRNMPPHSARLLTLAKRMLDVRCWLSARSRRSRIKEWFADYLRWMTRHEYGIEEREAKNSHGEPGAGSALPPAGIVAQLAQREPFAGFR